MIFDGVKMLKNNDMKIIYQTLIFSAITLMERNQEVIFGKSIRPLCFYSYPILVCFGNMLCFSFKEMK